MVKHRVDPEAAILAFGFEYAVFLSQGQLADDVILTPMAPGDDPRN